MTFPSVNKQPVGANDTYSPGRSQGKAVHSLDVAGSRRQSQVQPAHYRSPFRNAAYQDTHLTEAVPLSSKVPRTCHKSLSQIWLD